MSDGITGFGFTTGARTVIRRSRVTSLDGNSSSPGSASSGRTSLRTSVSDIRASGRFTIRPAMTGASSSASTGGGTSWWTTALIVRSTFVPS